MYVLYIYIYIRPRVNLACWCTYMSMASFGLSALRNSFSASSKRPSSSRNMANLRCTCNNTGGVLRVNPSHNSGG